MAATDLLAYRIRRWSALTWIVIICAAVFIAVRIAGAIMTDGARSLVDWLALPAYMPSALHRPWTPLTYMFTHYDDFQAAGAYWKHILQEESPEPRSISFSTLSHHRIPAIR